MPIHCCIRGIKRVRDVLLSEHYPLQGGISINYSMRTSHLIHYLFRILIKLRHVKRFDRQMIAVMQIRLLRHMVTSRRFEHVLAMFLCKQLATQVTTDPILTYLNGFVGYKT